MTAPSRLGLALLLLGLGAPLAAAQEEEPKLLTREAARRRILQALTKGPHPIRADLTRRQLERARVLEEDEQDGPCFAFVHRGAAGLPLCVTISRRTGHLIEVHQTDRDLIIASSEPGRRRSAAERRAELRRRVKVDRRGAERRARRALVHLAQDLGLERLELKEAQLGRTYGLVRWRLVFVQKRPPGALAHFANRVVVNLNPETGAVVFCLRTDEALEVRRPPLLTREAVLKLARAEANLPGTDVTGEARLCVIVPRPGQPRAVWAVKLERGGRIVRLLDIDAEHGEVYAHDDPTRPRGKVRRIRKKN